MCIAIAKPIGVEIPNDDILTNCFNNNPDGAGFAFNHNNEVVIRKGYMKLKDFLDVFVIFVPFLIVGVFVLEYFLTKKILSMREN